MNRCSAVAVLGKCLNSNTLFTHVESIANNGDGSYTARDVVVCAEGQLVAASC